MEDSNKIIIVKNFIEYIINVVNNVKTCYIDFSYIKSKGWNIIFKIDDRAVIRDYNPYLLMNKFNKYFYKNTNIAIINKVDEESISKFVSNIDFCIDKINDGYINLFFVIKYMDGKWYQRIFLDKSHNNESSILFNEDENILNVL